MFKHYLRSIHFQQYQFELQYLMVVKPIFSNIAFHFISALTAYAETNTINLSFGDDVAGEHSNF